MNLNSDFTKKSQNDKAFQRKKTVILIVAVFFLCVIGALSILFAYIYTSVSEDSNIYQTIVFRLSIFLLGSIVTMSVFTYNSKQKMSSIEFLHNKLPYLMLFGIISAFITLLTVPQEIYLPKIFLWEKLFTTTLNNFHELLLENLSLIHFLDNIKNTEFIFNIPNTLSSINLIFFIFSIIIFNIILYNFILSFYIRHIIEKNYISIFKKGKIKNFRSIDSIGVTAKLKRKQYILLTKKLEVFYQNLLYLISLNDSTLVNNYLIKWQEVTGTIQLLIFHSKINNKDLALRKKLYNKTLILTSNLILETSGVISYKEENIRLINALIGALPTQEQYFKDSNEAYKKMSGELAEDYFKHIYNLFNYLYESSNSNIYTMIMNEEIHFIEKIRSLYKQSLEYGREDKISLFVQDVFLSAIFKCISSKSNDLTTILGLLFVTQNNYVVSKSPPKKNKIESVIGDLFKKLHSSENVSTASKSKKKTHIDFAQFKADINQNLKKKLKVHNVIESDSININQRVIEHLIIAIAKACEIENYAAAGYLVKRVCNHIDFDTLENAFQNVRESFASKNNSELTTSIISLNPYSLNYCLEKSFFLLMLQIVYTSNYLFTYNLSSESLNKFLNLISEENKRNFIDSLKDRKKEYNLSCLSQERFESFDYYMNNLSRIIIFNNTNLFIHRNISR